MSIGTNFIGFHKQDSESHIKKFQEGGWTSEDVDNPVYSKKKPLPIKEQEELLIKSKQRQGLKNFDKGFQIGTGLLRLHPTYGIYMNVIDAMNDLKGGDYISDVKSLYDTIVE